MQGHFDLAMLHTPGLTRELIEAVRREGGHPAVEQYLREQLRDEEWSTDNLIVKTAPSYLYYRALSGPSIYGNPNGTSSFSGLAFIALTSTASEPGYTSDVYSGNLSWVNVPDNVGSNPSKRFINDCIVPQEIKVDPAGRESVYGKFKWLYLPGEATSSVIRSVTVYMTGEFNDLPATIYTRMRTGRVRIKDSGGNPVTIVKGATKSLLVEYTFTMPSL